MKRKQKLARFTHWRVTTDEQDEKRLQLVRILRRAAAYFDLPQPEHPLLKKDVLFVDALHTLGAQFGIKARVPKYSRMQLPLIARDKKSLEPVLLLPKSAHFYVIVGDSDEPIAAKDLGRRVDEVMELGPALKAHTSFAKFLSTLSSYTPTLAIVVVAVIAALVALGFLALCFFLPTDVGAHNFATIFFASCATAIVFIALLMHADTLGTKNYGLAGVLSFDQVFRRLLRLPAESLAKKTVHDVDEIIDGVQRGLVHLHFLRPRLILASGFIAMASMFLLALHPSLGVVVVGLSAIGAAIIYTAQNHRQRRAQNFSQARDALFSELNNYHNARFMIFGLDMHARIVPKLARAYAHAARLSERSPASKDAAFFLLPCGLFVAANYVMSFSSSSTSWLPQRMWLALTIILVLAIVIAFVAHHAHKIVRHGFSAELCTSVDAWPQEASASHVVPIHQDGAIDLKKCSFAYPEIGLTVIKEVSISIAAGDVILISGPSGVGKTTLLKILAGLLAPSKGDIAFDGQDARSLDQESLRNGFGVVFDNSDIFVGTIYHNILCGRSISEAALKKLLLSHEIFDVLLDLPMALQTYIIDRGRNISRLERTAILLARALVHEPKFLFLDEIFSGLTLKDQQQLADFLNDISITRIITSNLASVPLKPTKIIALGAISSAKK